MLDVKYKSFKYFFHKSASKFYFVIIAMQLNVILFIISIKLTAIQKEIPLHIS